MMMMMMMMVLHTGAGDRRKRVDNHTGVVVKSLRSPRYAIRMMGVRWVSEEHVKAVV